MAQKLTNFYSLCTSVSCAHKCTMHVPGARKREEGSDSLELGLQVVVSRDVGAGSQT